MTLALTLPEALALSGRVLGIAVAVQSAEHLALGSRDGKWFTARSLAGAALALGLFPGVSAALLALTSVVLLARMDGPYQGGADRMALLLACTLALAHLLPWAHARELALGYAAVQIVLSYFMAGVVKLANPEWRSGRAFAEVFTFSSYPVSEDLRAFGQRTALAAALAWCVMLFELAFPLALLDARVLLAALTGAFCFHVVNALLLGLNRFVWVWLAGYPLLLWFSARFVAPLLRH